MTTYITYADGSASITYPSGKTETVPSVKDWTAAVLAGKAFPYRLGATIAA